jgi:hypothetical protein
MLVGGNEQGYPEYGAPAQQLGLPLDMADHHVSVSDMMAIRGNFMAAQAQAQQVAAASMAAGLGAGGSVPPSGGVPGLTGGRGGLADVKPEVDDIFTYFVKVRCWH